MSAALNKAILLFLVLTSTCANASLETVPVTCGPPYSIPTSYSYSVSNAPSVSSAISQWWTKYKKYWGVSDARCGYSLSVYSELNITRAFIRLRGQCGGGDSVRGTATCPPAYTISANVCRLNGAEQPDKDSGPSCNNVGGPINAASGNKNKTQIDYNSGGAHPIVIYRTYNSNNDNLYLLGRAWNWNHGRALGIGSVNGNEFISLELDGGNKIRAVFDGGRWVTDEDINVEIIKTLESYQINYPDSRRDTYNMNGQLVRSDLTHDHRIIYSYGADNRLASICNAENKCLSLTYNSQGLVASVSRDGVVVVSYEYDSQSRLFKVSNMAGGVREYFYEDSRFPVALTGIKDEAGKRYSTYAYDAQGRGISTALADGQSQYLLAYNSDGSTTVTNPMGKQTTYTYEVIQGVKKIVSVAGHPSINCAASNKEYHYEFNGLLKSKTDWKGHLTTYDYNTRGLEVSRTEAAGTPQARTITTDWHPTLFLPVTVTEPSRITTYTYDAQGRQLSQSVTQR